VRRLLAFARQQQLQPTPVDILSLHKGVNDLLSHTLGGLVELDWRLPKEGWCAFADRSQLELALMNLAINARDAMPDGGTITIHADTQDMTAGNKLGLEPGTYVRLKVIDEGHGIPPDIADKVLEPFFTTKPVGKGTGLGLSMVYGFARQSGGTFSIGSEDKAGTKATLWLPQTSPIEETSGLAVQPRLVEDTPALSILLVDDHPEVRETTAALLRELGHDITEASSGAEALTILEDVGQKIDVLLSDYAMPQLSGTDLLIKARKILPDLPALLITGYADAEEIGERPDDVAILGKPFKPEVLAASLAEAVRRMQRSRVS
jgi:CheY-like chemotaxis protein